MGVIFLMDVSQGVVRGREGVGVSCTVLHCSVKIGSDI